MYNGNLVTALSIKSSLPGTPLAEKEQYKVTMQQIVDKNLEIAEAAYGAESIHLLY
jgi:tetratricopeptide (TPR) repeat protein